MSNVSQVEEVGLEVNSPDMTTEMDISSPPNEAQCIDTTPAQVEKHLDFATVNSGGQLLMGSSNMTSRYWCGSLWIYNNPTLAPCVEKCTVGYELTAGVADGEFIDGDKTLIIGQDNGIVEFLSLMSNDTGTYLISRCQSEEHMDAILSVAVTCDRKLALTGSADMSIRLWDCKTTAVSRVFSPAHSQQVTSLSTHPSHPELFLSTGRDGNVLLWDLRCNKPASCVYRDWDDQAECVSWVESENSGDMKFLLGTQSGSLILRNATELSENLASLKTFKRQIFRIKVNPFKRTQVAACANHSSVVVVNVNNDSLQVKYESDQHEDFVRGLAWLKTDELFSCGWDKKVFFHSV